MQTEMPKNSTNNKSYQRIYPKMIALFDEHNLNNSGASEINLFEKHKYWVWICACLGISVIFLSIMAALIPLTNFGNSSLF